MLLFLVFLVFASCKVTETIEIKPDGSGRIETQQIRDESSYMQITGENYAKEEIFEDADYHFTDIIEKYNATFSRISSSDQNVFNRYRDVFVHIKKNSYEKEFRTTIYQDFKKVEDIADLYKTEDYENDLRNNYALSAEDEHYFSINYTFVDDVFKRIVKITNQTAFKNKIEEIEKYKSQFARLKINQTYVIKYTFPRIIKSASNSKAEISKDKKTITLQFLLSESMQNPEITNLEVVLEKDIKSTTKEIKTESLKNE